MVPGGGDGGGHPVVALRIAKREGRKILTEFQYASVVEIIKRLADFGNREATADLDIQPFGDFWELRLKGGFLRKLNLRIYFAFQGEVIVLMAYKKEEDRQVSPHVMVTLEDRLEDYLSGALSSGISVYEQ